MKKSNKRFVLIVLIALFFMSVSYAYINTTLNINGTAAVNAVGWDVHFENVSVTTGSVTGDDPVITDDTSLEWSTEFYTPGEFYEFTVDVVNEGTLDAMIGAIDFTPLTTAQQNYLSYEIEYVDGASIEENQLLKTDATETIRIYLKLEDDISESDLPDDIVDLDLEMIVSYVQADDDAEEITIHMSDYSWDEIANIARINPSRFEVGDTKCVALDGFTTTNDNGCSNGEFAIRVANKSTPEECSTEGFSQTACGVVLEFADIITTHNMNPSGEYKGVQYNLGWNVDGWKDSEMRTYVNSTIYNALPSSLKNNIINTTVVSSHGSTSGETNFTTTDKLYLLSTHEVWVDVDNDTSTGPDRYDTAYNNTRQLDYYANLGVTTNNYSGAIKQRNGSDYHWWLRAANSNSTDIFLNVYSNGTWNNFNAYFTSGVAPAFRIG